MLMPLLMAIAMVMATVARSYCSRCGHGAREVVMTVRIEFGFLFTALISITQYGLCD